MISMQRVGLGTRVQNILFFVLILLLILNAHLLQKDPPPQPPTQSATLTQTPTQSTTLTQTPNNTLQAESNPPVAENNSFTLPKAELALMEKKKRVNYGDVWMSAMEIDLALRYLDSADTYFEWGSGGSTMTFTQFTSKAVSVEHNEEWCDMMTEKLAARKDLSHVDYRCVPVAIGTNGWGRKSAYEEGSYSSFRPYIDEIDKFDQPFDFVFVDGRARVDAAIKALSHIKDDSVVLLHDSRRVPQGKYQPVLKYYDVVDSCGGERRQGIYVMKRKKEFRNMTGDHAAVQEILDAKSGR